MFQGTPDDADLKHLENNVKPIIRTHPSYLIKKAAETLWCIWSGIGMYVPVGYLIIYKPEAPRSL